MVRLVLKSLDSPWAYELLPGLNTLGRNPTNDFRLSDPSVSSFHAELLLEDEVIRVRDLGSTNGTFIDDARVQDGVLKPENVLRLGNVRLALDEVQVTPSHTGESNTAMQRQSSQCCMYHPSERATYRCENCGSGFCASCVVIIGQGKFGATTMCPVCKGQCYPLPSETAQKDRPGLLARLTQTLKLPFSR